MKRIIFAFLSVIACALDLLAQEAAPVEVFPSAPYDRYIIFQSLALFWIAIIGLIIIIRMKLKEIERIQKMGIDREEKDIPLLD